MSSLHLSLSRRSGSSLLSLFLLGSTDLVRTLSSNSTNQPSSLLSSLLRSLMAHSPALLLGVQLIALIGIHGASAKRRRRSLCCHRATQREERERVFSPTDNVTATLTTTQAFKSPKDLAVS